ncbi:hypothetical protein SUDANB6_01808 [Streptomyces sp. enrichment culture]
MRGLLAPVERRNACQPAGQVGHCDPAGPQHLLSGARWDADAVRDDVRDYVAERLGPGGVLIIGDTGFIKKGTTSAGVVRQYTGTSGKIDDPWRWHPHQIGVFAACATGFGRVLVERKLYLPEAWASDRECCQAVKIPYEQGFTTKGAPARDIVRRCRTVGLPAAWVTANEVYGRTGTSPPARTPRVGYGVAVPESQQTKSLIGI